MSINIYYGEETYLLETAVKKQKKEFGETVVGINYIELDEETLINNLMPEIQTPPFGYPKKMIVVKNSGLFKKETKKKTSGLKELRDTLETYLKENIEELNQTLELIFIEESIEKLNITKTIEALGGKLQNFEQEKPYQLEKRLEAICKAYKVEPASGALAYLIETSGTSLQELINEIRKQIEYAGEGGQITKTSIDNLAIKTLDSNIFDLTDNLRQKKHIKIPTNPIRTPIPKRTNPKNPNNPIQPLQKTLHNKTIRKIQKRPIISPKPKTNPIFFDY